MKAKSTILFLLLTLSLAGCGKHKIDKGVVVDKSTCPAHLHYMYTGKTLLPMARPASYHLIVEDNGITETFRVSKREYSSVHVGDSIWFESIANKTKEE